ncbi:hypothetical protein RJ639_002916 [Escallonia herrerae]|uniref:Uncharacterized protein n=1 Tax=Escallonia herrerae TaxID=1293975 RepID=A0AA89AXL1_9ASTE|nr:hypothetical protein RJ639_002916 [Escallonia herrerae]
MCGKCDSVDEARVMAEVDLYSFGTILRTCAERWDGVVNIRKLIEEIGVKKKLSRKSWFDINSMC